MRIFVYGTLKEGYGLNSYLLASNNNCKKISDGVIHGFDMYTNGFYPYIVEVDDKTHTVTGEVWEINDSILMTELRLIEREYDETEVEVEIDGGVETCLAFVYKRDVRESWSKIESGIFSKI